MATDPAQECEALIITIGNSILMARVERVADRIYLILKT
jgi:hypothetical protein